MDNKSTFILIEGLCKDCGYPVINGDYNKNSKRDYHLFCSNPNCSHHTGIDTSDMMDDNDVDYSWIDFEWRERND